MKLDDYLKELDNDQDYQAASKKLEPILNLADEILELRLEKGWSQSELAHQAKTKQANISRIEAGLGNPTLKFVQKIAKALDCDLTIGLKETQPPEDSLQQHDEIKSAQVAAVTDSRNPLAQSFFGALDLEVKTVSIGTGDQIGETDVVAISIDPISEALVD